jgi:type VI secretion system secreted protein VgrG
MKSGSVTGLIGRKRLLARVAAALVAVGTLLVPAFLGGQALAQQGGGRFAGPAGRAPAAAQPRPLNRNWHPEARRGFLREDIRREFPRLGENFEVLDPTTGMRYNCIAHSLGTHSRWVNPPPVGAGANPLLYADQLYARAGYRRAAGLDLRLAPGRRKVAVYATVNLDGTLHAITHAAVQEADGSWTSKMGQMPLIRHLAPGDLRGSVYGVPVAVYVRPA